MSVVVLLSGGLDSATLLAKFKHENSHANAEQKRIYALNIFYGQKHDKELKCAENIAKYYQVPFKQIDLSMVFKESNCSLLNNSTNEIPKQSYGEQLEKMGGSGTVETYVPFRNGLFLSAAASYALSVDCDCLAYACHSDDYAGSAYPDCSPDFVRAMEQSIHNGSGGKLFLTTPFLNYTKKDIVKTGLALEVPYENTWSCYEGGSKPCGKCGTCIDRIRAFESNGAVDPLMQ